MTLTRSRAVAEQKRQLAFAMIERGDSNRQIIAAVRRRFTTGIATNDIARLRQDYARGQEQASEPEQAELAASSTPRPSATPADLDRFREQARQLGRTMQKIGCASCTITIRDELLEIETVRTVDRGSDGSPRRRRGQ